MQKHTKIYIDYFGYGIDDFIPCEICGSRATDTHHLECRGSGGSKDKDYIENLMALCRLCHERYGDKKSHFGFLKDKHEIKLKYFRK